MLVKLGLVVLFVVLALALSAITVGDLALLVPQRGIRPRRVMDVVPPA